MDRRSFIFGGVLAAGTIMSARGFAAGGPLAVEIRQAGRTFRYEEVSGADLGDYADPRGKFVQGCVLVVRDDCPVRVMFRPDRGGTRREIVFELGDPWSPNPANLGPYDVRILRGDAVIAQGSVPAHYWFSRWRWHTAPRKLIARPAELIAQRLLPAFDPALARDASHVRATGYTIMNLAGIMAYMPTTGERADIGAVTEAQGEYVCTQSVDALAAVMAQAEAAGTVPWNIRDPKTNAPVDVAAYPQASLYGKEVGRPFIRQAKVPVVVDDSHQPALAYLPYLLTGDPYHLETLQFQATWNILHFPPAYRYSINQVRANAWSMRTLGQAARITPDRVPSWLLPRQKFSRLLESHRDWLLRDFVNGSAPVRTVFRTTMGSFGDIQGGGSHGVTLAPWQEDMQAFIFGWLVQMGHDDWTPIFRWKLGSTLARTDGKSGWPRAVCAPYEMWLRPSPTSPVANSWVEAWRYTQPHQKIQPSETDHWIRGNLAYFSYARAVLAIAHQLGVPEAASPLGWVDNEWRRVMGRASGIEYKWAFAG